VEGDRTSVNMFTHHSTLVWADGVLKEKKKSRRRADKNAFGQDWESVTTEAENLSNFQICSISEIARFAF
jgi:hypothetical protein